MTRVPTSTGAFVTALCALECTVAFVPPTNVRIHKSSLCRHVETLSSQGNECPFIGVFPRFKIPLTTSKAENKGFQWPYLAGIQRSMESARLERNYGPLDYFPDQSGIQAFCSLWTAVADLEKETNSSSRILALPNCDKRILTNWIEMMDWIDDLEGLLNVSIKATRLEDQVIRIERIGLPQSTTPAILHKPDTIERRTKAWVKRLLVDMGICPFTKSITKSGQGLADLGVPVANIAYHTSQSRGIFLLMADTWKAISDMIEAGPSGKDGISSILLAAPEFDQAFDTWSGPVFCLLESGVVAAQAEGQVGVVCFHPDYKTPDGSTFPGFGHMHSVPRLERWVTEEKEGDCPFTKNDLAAGGAWQRRTPHATINVLRADQLEKAETRRQTPKLYTNNIEAILSIGSEQLHEDLNRERALK
jgi:hypothetical protein